MHAPVEVSNTEPVAIKEVLDLWQPPIVAHLRPFDDHHAPPGPKSELSDFDEALPQEGEELPMPGDLAPGTGRGLIDTVPGAPTGAWNGSPE